MSFLDHISMDERMARRKTLKTWRKELKGARDAILEALKKDTGKDPAESFIMEWHGIDSTIEFLERELEDVAGPQRLRSGMSALLGSRELVQRRLPVGHVLIVGTWNFPVALHLGQILFARAAGNKVTFKPSPQTPALAEVFAQWLPSIFGVDELIVWNPTPEETLEAVRQRRFDLVIFTGGTGGAHAFAKACGEAMIPFVAEASGSESGILLESSVSPSHVAATVDHLLWAAFHHSGQTCVAPRFWFVPANDLERVWLEARKQLSVEELSARSRSPLKAVVVRSHEEWKRWAASLAGAELFEVPARSEFFVARMPQVSKLPIQSPETFGPGVLMVGYDRLEDVVKWIRSSPWSLMTSVFGQVGSADAAHLSQLDASIVAVGEAVAALGDAAVPFGGRGSSGYGTWHGREGLRTFTRPQTFLAARPWPGMRRLGASPSWKGLSKLRQMGALMRDMEDNPFKALGNWLKGRGAPAAANEAKS